jgi:hypothetical protein
MLTIFLAVQVIGLIIAIYAFLINPPKEEEDDSNIY